MDRIAQNVSSTLSQTFYVNGVATDPVPDTATVTITRDDGTAIVTGAATSQGAGPGEFTYTLSPAQTATLDILTVAWTATIAGFAQTVTDTVEVVGGFLFSLAQARALPPLNDTTTYPTSKIAEYRTLAEQAFEDACGVAFVPRYRRQTFYSHTARSSVSLSPQVRVFRSAESDGTTLVATDVDLDPVGVAYYGWSGQGSIAYEHGYDRPPEPVSRAVLLLAKTWLVKGPLDDRTTQMATEDGPINIAVPGLRGSYFGIPSVDAAVEQYGIRAYVG